MFIVFNCCITRAETVHVKDDLLNIYDDYVLKYVKVGLIVLC